MIRPHVMVYAGPNGSGKSTITEKLSVVGTYINADEIKKKRSCADLEAALEAEQLREMHISESKNFTFETVLSTPRNIDLLSRAKALGYYIESVFVLTISPDLNVLRVASRTLDGGHDVPEDKIRRRYEKSLQQLPQLIALSDKCIIIDNTASPSVIFMKENGQELFIGNTFWSYDQIHELVNVSAKDS